MESRCRTRCCSKSTLRLLVLNLIVVIYIICGALIFQALEGYSKTQVFSSFKESRENFLSRMSNHSLTEEDVDDFVETVLTAGWNGVFAKENDGVQESNWSFGRSIFFVVTLLSTIGYGHMTPVSDGGKVFTIFYIMIGVPLIMVCLSAIVSRLMKPIGRASSAVKARLCTVKEFHADLLYLMSIFIIFLILFFVIPAAIFTSIEPTWTYLDALYFCFISLFTIGLGDLVPGEGDSAASLKSLYFLCISGWLTLGLISVMVLLAMIYNIPALDLNNCFTMDPAELTDPERTKLADCCDDLASASRAPRVTDDDAAVETSR